jgi:hypothetical protein
VALVGDDTPEEGSRNGANHPWKRLTLSLTHQVVVNGGW